MSAQALSSWTCTSPCSFANTATPFIAAFDVECQLSSFGDAQATHIEREPFPPLACAALRRGGPALLGVSAQISTVYSRTRIETEPTKVRMHHRFFRREPTLMICSTPGGESARRAWESTAGSAHHSAADDRADRWLRWTCSAGCLREARGQRSSLAAVEVRLTRGHVFRLQAEASGQRDSAALGFSKLTQLFLVCVPSICASPTRQPDHERHLGASAHLLQLGLEIDVVLLLHDQPSALILMRR